VLGGVEQISISAGLEVPAVVAAERRGFVSQGSFGCSPTTENRNVSVADGGAD
jgi:hypothetical protein